MRRQHLKALLLALAGIAIALTLACGTSALAVRRGVLAPADVNLSFGLWRLVGGTSRLPQCSQLINPGCVDVNPVPVTYIYTLWLFTKRDNRSWDNPHVRRLMVMELGRR
jgi:hypothetical protein